MNTASSEISQQKKETRLLLYELKRGKNTKRNIQKIGG